MDQQHIVRIIGFGKLYDGEHFLSDCRYELAEYVRMPPCTAAEHAWNIESLSRIEGSKGVLSPRLTCRSECRSCFMSIGTIDCVFFGSPMDT